MTRSYGSGGGSGTGGPDWQRRPQRPDFREREPQPDILEPEAEDDILAPAEISELPWESKLNRLSRYSASDEKIQASKVEFGRRLVSLMIDMVAAYLISAMLAVVPLINAFVTTTLVLTFVMLVRDFFFEGRGIGKNLMGLQVVDIRTGAPCSFMQSIKRNIIILAPLMVLQLIMLVLRLTNGFVTGPISNQTAGEIVRWLNDGLPGIVNVVGGLYVIAVFPYEIYRVYNRPDGRRLGDAIAGTTIVEAPMDFSAPLPRR